MHPVSPFSFVSRSVGSVCVLAYLLVWRSVPAPAHVSVMQPVRIWTSGLVTLRSMGDPRELYFLLQFVVAMLMVRSLVLAVASLRPRESASSVDTIHCSTSVLSEPYFSLLSGWRTLNSPLLD